MRNKVKEEFSDTSSLPCCSNECCSTTAIGCFCFAVQVVESGIRVTRKSRLQTGGLFAIGILSVTN